MAAICYGVSIWKISRDITAIAKPFAKFHEDISSNEKVFFLSIEKN